MNTLIVEIGNITVSRISPEGTSSLIIKCTFSDNWTVSEFGECLNIIGETIEQNSLTLQTTYLIMDFSSNPTPPKGSMQAIILVTYFRHKYRCMFYGIATIPALMVLIQQIFTKNVQISEEHALMAIRSHPVFQ